MLSGKVCPEGWNSAAVGRYRDERWYAALRGAALPRPNAEAVDVKKGFWLDAARGWAELHEDELLPLLYRRSWAKADGARGGPAWRGPNLGGAAVEGRLKGWKTLGGRAGGAISQNGGREASSSGGLWPWSGYRDAIVFMDMMVW